jgi:hypothetical protein
VKSRNVQAAPQSRAALIVRVNFELPQGELSHADGVAADLDLHL